MGGQAGEETKRGAIPREVIDVAAAFRAGAMANELREALEKLDPYEPVPAEAASAFSVADIVESVAQVLPGSLAEELKALVGDVADTGNERLAISYIGACRRVFGWCNGLVQAAGGNVPIFVDHPAGELDRVAAETGPGPAPDGGPVSDRVVGGQYL